MVRCFLCRKSFSIITNTHLAAAHLMDVKEYTKRYGSDGVGFAKKVFQLSRSDPRYIQWRKNLLLRPAPWSKGYTKETHPSLAKLSRTFQKRGIDNFSAWREEAKRRDLIPNVHISFKKNSELAFLIGLILGDGNISKFPRTECLRIALGTDKPALWKYTVKVAGSVFHKKPAVFKRRESACMTITIYQKSLGKRLGVPLGARKLLPIKLPRWIWNNQRFLISCLKGLFEAEGSFSIHKRTCTYNLSFSNLNVSLLDEVERALVQLGFHPERRTNAVRLRKRHEALSFADLIAFRKYPG